MNTWNPWHGCHKISEGCRHCYVYRRDESVGRDASHVVKTADYDLPVRRRKDGSFLIPSHSDVGTCFTSDFLLEDADPWRRECWEMIRLRSDCTFFFITKRIDRFLECIPADWGQGYENVAVGCTCENQDRADYRLPLFRDAPIRHKSIILEPMLEAIDLSPYLGDWVEEVSIGGESGEEARILDYDWVLDVRHTCIRHQVPFYFHQTGALLQKDGRLYKIPRNRQGSQARKAGIDYPEVPI